MMQRLRFRGGSQASPSPGGDVGPDGRSGRRMPPARCVTPGSLGPARPLRLVYCGDDGKFLMDPEAVATLQLVKGPVAVVSVCGRARQGKSFILNQLLGRSSGFHVASTHKPCTKGLWIWSAPLHQIALDGTEYNLLLLDTEGIDAYDQTGTYSTQIFSLAVLLSSMFIYNQMGGIDEAALDHLSLVTEMTKHVRVRATGGRSTASELAQFSPVFVWLLRDFYLDLAEEDRKITPCDYLELALRPVQGRKMDISSKNEIRESICSLFPDRDCFTLVRPLNSETELQQLDQIPLDRLRPEFRSGLDALTKYIFKRTNPKKVGGTMMTGPVLAAITQSFLDAMNNGAVPTLLSSWQSVEEAECRRAYDSAIEVYMSSVDHTKSAEESVLEEVHEEAVKKSLALFNAVAVGAGSARMMYEKLLQNFSKKAFEDYKQSAFLDANFRCSNALQLMEKKLREDCHHPDARIDNIVKSLDKMLSDYDISCHGPSKWRRLSTFLKQCLEGPITDILNKQLNQSDSERSSLALKSRTTEEKIELLKKQLEFNEKHRSEYLKRYEDAVSDKQKASGDLSACVVNLQSKFSTLEECYMGLSKDLDLVKNESSGWRIKCDLVSSEFKTKEEIFKSQKGSIESRIISIEANLGAAREQALSAQEDASKWKRKYENSAQEAKIALERAEFCEDQAKKKAQEREDTIRGEFYAQLVEKEVEIKNLNAKLEQTDSGASALIINLEAAESKVLNHDFEVLPLKNEVMDLIQKLDSVKAITQLYENEIKILEQENNHLQEKCLSVCKKFEDAEERSNAAERCSKNALKLADAALSEVACIQKERSEIQQLALERSTALEEFQKQIDTLEQEKERLIIEVGKLHQSQLGTFYKVTSLERHVDEREEEIEEFMSHSNEQRSSTVHVLENLLATERAARAEASSRAEALSMQLQTSQHKLDALLQELASTRLSETALESKLRTVSHGKRPRVDVQDMESDEGVVRGGRKRSKSPTSPLKCVKKQDGSVLQRWRKFISKPGNSRGI